MAILFMFAVWQSDLNGNFVSWLVIYISLIILVKQYRVGTDTRLSGILRYLTLLFFL